jgi:hypothetical protein
MKMKKEESSRSVGGNKNERAVKPRGKTLNLNPNISTIDLQTAVCHL